MTLFRKYRYGDYDSLPPGGTADTQPTSKQDADKRTVSPETAVRAEATSPLGGGGAEWPLWEVFVRSKQGLDHKHVGSLHAADATMAVENARDVYTRRQEGVSIWVVESQHIHASNPDEAESFYEPANDKVYRHPTFYDLPDEIKHM